MTDLYHGKLDMEYKQKDFSPMFMMYVWLLNKYILQQLSRTVFEQVIVVRECDQRSK